jgi:hypothetical protein
MVGVTPPAFVFITFPNYVAWKVGRCEGVTMFLRSETPSLKWGRRSESPLPKASLKLSLKRCRTLCLGVVRTRLSITTDTVIQIIPTRSNLESCLHKEPISSFVPLSFNSCSFVLAVFYSLPKMAPLNRIIIDTDPGMSSLSLRVPPSNEGYRSG